jgi:hypothetical protein
MIDYLNILKSIWEWLIVIIVIGFIFWRNNRRGFFWKARDGSELSFKEFGRRWLKGVEGITPKQQTVTSLWGFPFIFGGILTGLVINILHKQWWLVLILIGSTPLTLMQLVSTWQKYKSQKIAEEAMEEAMNVKEVENG